MNASKYFVILLFGAIISASVLVFDTKLKKVYKYLINYAALLSAFSAVFLTTPSGAGNHTARVFAAIVIFSIIYGAVLIFRYFLTKVWHTKAKKRR